MNPLLSESPEIVARALRKAIDDDGMRYSKLCAREGVAYYEGQHEILKNRIFYINDNGVLKEDKYASNIRIPHRFFTELVDQKVQYLLGKPFEYSLPENHPSGEQYKAALDGYYTPKFRVMVSDMIENASQKGREYVLAWLGDDNTLKFTAADSLGIFAICDDTGAVLRVIRYYEKDTFDGKGKLKTFEYAEVWSNTEIWYFRAPQRKQFVVDDTREHPQRPHTIAIDADGNEYGKSFGFIPIFELMNNQKGQTDLEPVKAIIDDYDLMNAFLSNNLQDFSEAIYVVTGFPGDDLSKLRQNIKAKKVVGLPAQPDAGVKVETFNIPTEGRVKKMEIDRENIYKFGMGFDSLQVGDGNITNIVIKSRYALLDLKANKAEIRLLEMLDWINRLVVQDINRRMGTAYNPADVTFTIHRNALVNAADDADIKAREAEAVRAVVETILSAASVLPEETVIEQLCAALDLDPEEVKKQLEEAQYTLGLPKGTEQPVNTDGDGA